MRPSNISPISAIKLASRSKSLAVLLILLTPADRKQLMAELDAAYFILYGIDRDDAAYILSTFSGVFEADPLLPGERSQGDHILNTIDWLLAHSASR